NNINVVAQKRAQALWLGLAGRVLYSVYKVPVQNEKTKDGIKVLPETIQLEVQPRVGIKLDLIYGFLERVAKKARHRRLLNEIPTFIKSAPGLGLEYVNCFWFGNEFGNLLGASHNAEAAAQMGRPLTFPYSDYGHFLINSHDWARVIGSPNELLA